MEEIVKEYIYKIKEFQNIIKAKYNLTINPCYNKDVNFEKKGIVNDFAYWFHGTGCSFKQNNIIYNYDSSIFVEDEIQFSLWEFSEFLNSHPIYKINNYNSEYIEVELQKLIDKGILSWLVINDRIYKTYRVLINQDVIQKILKTEIYNIKKL